MARRSHKKLVRRSKLTFALSFEVLDQRINPNTLAQQIKTAVGESMNGIVVDGSMRCQMARRVESTEYRQDIPLI